MILIPGSLSFTKLVMMSSAPAKSAGDARYASQDPFIHGFMQCCPIQSRLQSVLGVLSSVPNAKINISHHPHLFFSSIIRLFKYDCKSIS